MKFLFDTHAWYWSVAEPERLPGAIQRILKTARREPIGLSAISVWELCKLVERRRITLHLPLSAWIEASIDPAYITLLPLTPAIAAASVELPGRFQRDPADQIVAATARLENLTLITKDRALQAYPHVRAIWER